MSQNKKLAATVTLVVGAIPALYIGSFVARHGVEVPMMDDWEMAPVIAKAHTGELTFSDLFEQQEEARTIVPKLIFILSASGGHWDVRDQMMLSVAICVATAAGIFVLLRRSGLGVVAVAVCFWASSLLIFSPAQFELWLFASGFPSYLPVFCIVAALLVLGTRWSLGVKFSLSGFLSLISTFTLAHGMLAWGLTFPVLLAGERPRRWKRWLVAWCALAATAAAVYFYGYRKPPHLPDFGPAMSAAEYVQFLLAFLGGSLAYAAKEQRVAMAIVVGAVTMAVLVTAAANAASRSRDAEFTRRVLPWFALGLYSIASAVLVALGRGAFGLDYAISSRYVTFSLYAPLAAAVLGAIVGGEIFRQPRFARRRTVMVVATVLLVALLAHLQRAASISSVRILRSIEARNRLARSAIVFSPVLDTAATIKAINYPDPQRAFSFAERLDGLGILRPRLVRSADVAALPNSEVDDRTAAGWCDALVAGEGDEIRASGWATLSAKGRPADAVVLAFQRPEGEWVAFAMSDAVVRRRDIKKMLRNKDHLWSGWTATFRRDAVPPGAAISAWAVDIDEPRLYRLKQNAPELKL